MSTKAALTSIQALSQEDCAAATRCSSCANLSVTAWETSAVVAEVAPDVVEGGFGAAEAGVCRARRGTARSTMVISKQHCLSMCFIAMSAPLRMGSAWHGQGCTKKDIGDPRFFAVDYT